MTTWMLIVKASEWFFLLYFISMNVGYIALNLLSLINLKRYMPNKSLDDMPQVYSGLEIPVSILVPAYNEEATITPAIHSMLQLNYAAFEILIINDGSRDRTLEVLIQDFALLPFPEAYRSSLTTQNVRGVYRSTSHPNVRVIDKDNGGKADSLNAGINASRYPLFCAVDADTILQRDSLQQIVYPFLEDHRVVAAGGTIRIANGCTVSGGFITKIDLPGNLLALFQVIEYLRAFLFGRLGWSAIGGLLIISGAFGLFRKEVVIEVGGFRVGTIGEDMELVMRMHRLLRQQQKPYRMVFLPDPVAWTEAPEDLRTLKNQRVRWQRGLAESLSSNLGLLCHRNGGVPGWLAFPFLMIFEWLGPLFEVMGYVLMGLFFCNGLISAASFWAFTFATLGLGLMLSVSSLMLEEMSFHIYNRPRHLVLLLLAAILENFGYRQLNSIWRMIGLFQWLIRSKSQWGVMKRIASR